MSTPVLLELRGVTAAYGRSVVLRDVSLSVPPATITALLGPNGAGKTTLLRLAAGLHKPSQGSVHLAGEDVTRLTPSRRARQGLCLVPEGRGVFRNLTVRENLQMQVPDGRPASDIELGIDAFPVLGQRLTQVAGTMSGGQQQMLALARCSITKPRLVLLDEVSMGLAPQVIEEIFQSLRRLADTGVSLLLVEQYVSRALEMAEQVHLLNRGTVTFSGPPSELDEEAVVRGYLGGTEGTLQKEHT